jgi:hypothetical protein
MLVASAKATAARTMGQFLLPNMIPSSLSKYQLLGA